MTNHVTHKHLPLVATLFTILILGLSVVPQVHAQDNPSKHKIENPDVTIAVNGLACPFCAYGLEKKLSKIEGVEEVDVEMEEGQVHLKLKYGKIVTEETIVKTVKDAGFTPTKISYAADGETSR